MIVEQIILGVIFVKHFFSKQVRATSALQVELHGICMLMGWQKGPAHREGTSVVKSSMVGVFLAHAICMGPLSVAMTN